MSVNAKNQEYLRQLEKKSIVDLFYQTVSLILAQGYSQTDGTEQRLQSQTYARRITITMRLVGKCPF